MKKIAIRLDAGKSIGSGHLMRCLALADALSEICECEILFICRNQVRERLDYPVFYISMPYATNENVYEFPSIIDEIEELKKILLKNKIDCLIVDHYGAKDDYFYMLWNTVGCLVCIDDSLKRCIPVDVILNGNIYGQDAVYKGNRYLLSGNRYLLMRKKFQHLNQRHNKQEVKEVYITSGGADPFGFCKQAADIISKAFKNICVHIIIGSDFSTDYEASLHNTGKILHKNADMRRCMEEADFFISGAGSTLYELAACGVPSISYVLAEDQRLLSEYMHRLGTTYVCGDFSEFDANSFYSICNSFFNDKEMRDSMSSIGQSVIDGMGAMNAARKLIQILE